MPKLLTSRYLSEPSAPQATSNGSFSSGSIPVGVLLVNLGTPDEPTAPSIRRYLAEFLSDPRVVELPSWLWQVVLRTFILTRRPKALVPRYQDIWLKEGSPLLVWSRAQADGIQGMFNEQGLPAQVELAMRYGHPSIPDAIEKLRGAGCERILVVPMYPQYAASTTATAVDRVASHAKRLRNQPEFRFVKRYHDAPGYIDALAQQVRAYWNEHGKPERLLLSFHGIPQRTVDQGDPYFSDCMQTVALLKQALGEDADRVHVSFQSRFGAEKWLQPYTEPTLREWARAGVKHVDVMCPGFLADCLETLEEIQVECREAFLAEGGQQFRYLPCLNDDPHWVRNFSALIRTQLQGWI